MIEVFIYLGTFFFAISGVLTGLSKKLDVFGVFIIAFVTSLGGGTLRDVLIGWTPVAWMNDFYLIYIIVFATIFSVVFRNKLDKLRTSLFLFDTIGLGIFTIVGIEKGLRIGLDPTICIALGTITACFGGVVRDILCNEIPILFRREIYATICVAGGTVYFLLKKLNFEDDVIFIVTASFIITMRLLTVKFKWKLPSLYE